MEDEVIAVVEASQIRRWIAVIMLTTLSGLLIYVAFDHPTSTAWQVFLLAAGALGLWMSAKLHKATEHRIELTETELRDSSGRRLALVKDILLADRGYVAFKPSNGFVIRTAVSAPRAWMPGMWWRLGRRVGVGGVTPAPQAKLMSDKLTEMIALRGQDDSQST